MKLHTEMLAHRFVSLDNVLWIDGYAAMLRIKATYFVDFDVNIIIYSIVGNFKNN